MINGSFQGSRNAINYFRLGTIGNSEEIDADVQRRIVIVNGSNRELLFSLTPPGVSDVVRAQVNSQRDTMLAAINSVTAAVDVVEEEVGPISIVGTQVDNGSLTIDFTNDPGATGFSILGSPDLADPNPEDISDSAVVTETSEGTFRAVVDLSGMDPRMFFWISR